MPQVPIICSRLVYRFVGQGGLWGEVSLSMLNYWLTYYLYKITANGIMARTMTIEQLLAEILKLDAPKQQYLIAQVMEQTAPKSENSSKSQTGQLTALGGLGAEIWQDEDIDAYILKERQWD